MDDYHLIPLSEEEPLCLPVVLASRRNLKKGQKNIWAYIPAFPFEPGTDQTHDPIIPEDA